MNISMTKRQIKETLREMGVSYSTDADENDLKQLLQRENHRRWLEQAGRSGTLGRPTIRRRRSAPR